MNEPLKKPLTLSEAAKKGGDTTKSRHGVQHYKDIANKRWGKVKKSPINKAK